MIIQVTPLLMPPESAGVDASSGGPNSKQLALLAASLVGRGVVSALNQLSSISGPELIKWAPLLQVVERDILWAWVLGAPR